jgi:hypothetical protein
MKTQKVIIILALLITNLQMSMGQANTKLIEPDLSDAAIANNWNLCNREISVDNKSIYLNAMPGEGLLILDGLEFTNGVIEAEIKGKDLMGRSFVGIAFHILNDSVYDAIYFRPFNFKNPERNNHSVQYISQPQYTWHYLRENQPEKFESTIKPVPDPKDWFHIKIVVEHPVVKVFVNDSTDPSLIINQLSTRKEGKIGFWVGNYSDGYFRLLKVLPQ